LAPEVFFPSIYDLGLGDRSGLFQHAAPRLGRHPARHQVSRDGPGSRPWPALHSPCRIFPILGPFVGLLQQGLFCQILASHTPPFHIMTTMQKVHLLCSRRLCVFRHCDVRAWRRAQGSRQKELRCSALCLRPSALSLLLHPSSHHIKNRGVHACRLGGLGLLWPACPR